MPEIESLLNRWQSAGVLDAETAARIRAHESKTSARESPSLRWQGITALVLGAILLACGVALFVNSHWDDLGPGARFALVMAIVAVFHFAGGVARANYRGLSTALHGVGTLSAGPAIALVGQIFNIEEHWPAAVLMWAIAALAGWILLHDQAQQTLTLLLFPAWLISELSYRMDGHIGESIYLGRVLFTWSILYLTFFAASRRKVTAGILFAAAAIAAITGTVLMLDNWASWSADQTFIPFGTRVWAWIVIAALPLIVAAIHGHKGLIPIAASIAMALALPWCYRTWIETYTYADRTNQFTRFAPNLAAHALVAAFTVFLCWWGVRLVSRALVNLGIAGFAATVAWFYFSDLFTKLGRSLGLIVLGILFLAGGWALEKTRRRILMRMAGKDSQPQAPKEAR